MVIGGSTWLGFDSALNIAEEATFGTVNSTPAEGLKFTSESLKETIDEVLIPTINTTRQYLDRFQANVSVEGSLEYPFHHTDGILFFKHAMGGTVTTAVISAGVSFAHTFTPGDSLDFGTETSLSITLRRGDNYYREYGGCRVNSYTLAGAMGETLNVTAEILGQKSASPTTVGAINFTEGIPFTFKDAKFYEADSIGSLTITSGEQYITNFELTINNNITNDELVRSLGTNTVMDLPPNALKDVTLNVTQRFDTNTAYNYYLTGTARAVMIVVNSGVTITGGDATTYSMRFSLPKCYYNEDGANVGGPGVLTQVIPFRAVSDSVTGFDIQAVLNNGTASY